MKEERIQWHQAFQQAIKAEFAEYKNVLEFISEIPLTTEPLIMDTLVVKKDSDIKIEKNIGRIFRRYNVLEYKSPEDSLNYDNYNKSFAYTHLYASLSHISINEISLTLVVSAHPRSLLKCLKDDINLQVMMK